MKLCENTATQMTGHKSNTTLDLNSSSSNRDSTTQPLSQRNEHASAAPRYLRLNKTKQNTIYSIIASFLLRMVSWISRYVQLFYVFLSENELYKVASSSLVKWTQKKKKCSAGIPANPAATHRLEKLLFLSIMIIFFLLLDSHSRVPFLGRRHADVIPP